MKSRPVERNREDRVEFLGEQDGLGERELKVELTKWLSGDHRVRRAYLAKVGFQPGAAPSVALCVLSTNPDPALIKGAAAIFGRLFATGNHLDVLFITQAQDEDVRRVCLPFYEGST